MNASKMMSFIGIRIVRMKCRHKIWIKGILIKLYEKICIYIFETISRNNKKKVMSCNVIRNISVLLKGKVE